MVVGFLPFLAVVYPVHIMSCEVGPYLTVCHIYAIEDPKDVGGALCGGQPIIHKEVSSNPAHRNFHPTFYEAIIEITTEPGGLFMTSHSPNSQCRRSTQVGILY